MSKHQFRSRLPIHLKKHVDIIKTLTEEDMSLIRKGKAITPREMIDVDMKMAELRGKLKSVTGKYKETLELLRTKIDAYNAVTSIVSSPPPNPIVQTEKNGKESTSVPIIQYSDWHIDEVVTSGQTNGLNKYNYEIAKERATILARNTVKLIKSARKDAHVNEVVVHLGGDFFSGWIHPEGVETNSMTPVMATIAAKDMIQQVLEYVYDNSKIKRMVVLCSRGNHSRTTKKLRYANEMQTSLETGVYQALQNSLTHKNIEFYVPEAAIGYYEIMGKVIRFYHGQQIRYINGIGGITISLNKKQAGWDKTRKADFNLMGHYHSASMPNQTTMMNGSLIGFNAFAQTHSFQYSPPEQAFICLNSKYGFTNFNKIACY